MLNLKYFDGAQPKKRKPEKPNDYKKEYEPKRERSFKVQWQIGRPWLKFDEGPGLMFCSDCREFGFSDKESTFVKGTSSLRLDGIKFHESSSCHIKAVGARKVKDKPAHETTAAKSLVSLKKAEYDRLAIKMRNAHAIAKHNLSFKNYEVLCRLDKIKGLDIGNQYCTDKAAASFCSSIAHTSLGDVIQELKSCEYCSLTCDGSTDFMGEDVENIYLRISSIPCTIKDTFLYIGTAESASSEDIHKFILNMFATLSISDIMNDKLVGFCADGASNMQGNKSGLAALMKKTWPHLIFTHCLAHRLELAFKDAIKKSSPNLYEKGTTLLLGLYYLFKKSPKQKKGLQRSFEALGVKQILPTRIGGTRWLPHYQRALQVFGKAYKVLRYQLENASHHNAKAEGLARLIKDGHVVSYLLSLKRIISNLTGLSLYLQKPENSLADALTRVKTTITTLQQTFKRDDSTVSTLLETEKFHDETLTFRGGKPSIQQGGSIVDALVTALETRFPTSFVSATSITSFRNWPALKPEDVKVSTYGDDEVKSLFEHFKEVLVKKSEDVCLDILLDEWATLRSLIYEKFTKQMESVTLTWMTVYRELGNCELDHVFQLVHILLALPPTSVNNETAFSAMKLLKTKRRGRLTSQRLNDLMVVKLNSPDIENFMPDAALNHWMHATPSGQKRRKERTTKVATSTSKALTVESDSDLDEEQESEPIQEEAQALVSSFGNSKDDSSDVDDDDEEDDDLEMPEDYVFSLIYSFRE